MQKNLIEQVKEDTNKQQDWHGLTTDENMFHSGNR